MYKKIMVPVDLAEASSWEEALPVAIELAQLSGGSISVVTVITGLHVFLKGSSLPTEFVKLIEQAERTLTTIVAGNIPSELAGKPLVKNGSICREILQASRDEQVELIVMAAHPPGVSAYFLGPHAAHIVSHAKCSVLVVRQ
jgi:nucleotide-binding universal stress UspA family protein